MLSEARKRANARSDKKNTRQIKLKLMKSTDADVLAKLDSVENKTGYIRELIRKDIGR